MEASADFMTIFRELEDPRIEGRSSHKLIDILTITLCAVICGADSWELIAEVGKSKLDWFKSFLELPNGIPSHDTFSRVFSIIDPDKFLDCFTRWVSLTVPMLSEEIVAIDGKSLRAASKRAETPLHMITAFAVHNGIVLGQMKSKGKKNEIKTLPLLLEKLVLKGCIVTLDAMGCQRNVVKQIVNQEADYVISLKGNQGRLHEDVKLLMDSIIDGQTKKVDFDYYETIEKGHGRIEIRRCYVTEHIDFIESRDKWAGLTSVGCLESTRIIGDKETTERRYHISSIKGDAKKFGSTVRSHWSVENNVHWVMDVIFNEDKALQSADHAAENMALLRRLSLNLLKKHPEKKSLKSKKLRACMDTGFLEQLIFGVAN